MMVGPDAHAERGTNVLVVCTGNVCRSPLVAALLNEALTRAYGVDEIGVTSAGTHALVGQPMDARSATILSTLGGDARGFLARQVTPQLVQGADLVLTATRDHRARVVKLHPRALRYTFTVRELAALVSGMPLFGLPTTAKERVASIATAARARKGLVHLGQEELDIIDPYLQDDPVYRRFTAEASEAAELIASALAPGRG